MKLIPILLLFLGSAAVHADSHSLLFYETTVSAPGSRLPVYFIVVYVDDQQIANYSGDTQQTLPKTEWIKKMEPELWDESTKLSQTAEPFMRHNLQVVMKEFNHTGGTHTYQSLYGCELRDDGSTAGNQRDGYDGRDFLYLDTQRGIFIPAIHEAQLTTQRWNSPEVREGERMKSFLDTFCLEWLKVFTEYGRDDLEIRVRPEVKVWGRQHPDGVTRLQCLAYGFHPRAVDVKWVRNREDHIPSDEASPILPHPDGTYQTRVSVEVPTREGDTYSCHVEHSSLEETLTVTWDPNAESKDKMQIVIIAVSQH
ncbi:class I histocompatibility antigen, F10 alpha chain-like [Hyperolius riggenbachi]|uniref:class I histocompatibility antigen, F10 alpha chain-like n=1 Tax=Hyperolius riggenbachi TaxID=752182 RepID=UPI0035A270F0